MAIEFRCSQCGQLLRVAESSAGKNARCPGCQAIMPVPAASDLATRALTPLSPPPAQSPPFVPAPPPTAPTPQDDLFAYLKQATTPVGQPAPPPAATSGPFADLLPAGSQPTSANPYASPAFAAMAPTPLAGNRPGLPWENQPTGFSAWWETSQLCLGDAEGAFRQMRQEGGISSPLMYAIWGQLLGFAGQTVWMVPAMALQMLGGQGNNQASALGIAIELLVRGLATLLVATVGLFVSAAITHLFLTLVGGARGSYETTYRVTAFTAGSIAWLNVIPCFGPLIYIVMSFVCMIQGLAQAHETTVGKSAAAVLLPCFVCGGLACAGFIALIAVLGNQ